MTVCRGIRGATIAEENTAEAIYAATRELLDGLIDANGIRERDVAAVYFTMTGLHGLHVLGGMVVIAYLLGPGAKMWNTEPERFTNRAETFGLYWHFVDLVWIFLFPALYLL